MPSPLGLSITLFLFLIAPFFRKWVDLVVWPKLADWWALRSQASLRKRIQKLEAMLSTIEALPTLTEFENLVLRSITGIVMLLMLIPVLAVMAYIMAFSDVQIALIPKDLYRQTILTLLAVLYWLSGLGIQRFVERFRRERSLEYRVKLKTDVESLQASLFSGK